MAPVGGEGAKGEGGEAQALSPAAPSGGEPSQANSASDKSNNNNNSSGGGGGGHGGGSSGGKKKRKSGNRWDQNHGKNRSPQETERRCLKKKRKLLMSGKGTASDCYAVYGQDATPQLELKLSPERRIRLRDVQVCQIVSGMCVVGS